MESQTTQNMNPQMAQAPKLPAIPEPKYTMRWLGLQTFFVFGISIIFTMIASGIDSLAESRAELTLLSEAASTLVCNSTGYCFAITAISLLSLTLIEIRYRKTVNYLQYGLTGCALCLFFLLLLAMAEKMPFYIAYAIVTAMTVGLIGTFVKGIMAYTKAVVLTAGILIVEYGIILLLLYMGSMALLIGSLSLFVILAIAMYFTLKLKVIDRELTIQ